MRAACILARECWMWEVKDQKEEKKEDVCFDYWMRGCLIEGDDWWINPSNYAFPSFRLNCHCQHNESLMTTLRNSRANPPNQIKSLYHQHFPCTQAFPFLRCGSHSISYLLQSYCSCHGVALLWLLFWRIILLATKTPSKDKPVSDCSCRLSAYIYIQVSFNLPPFDRKGLSFLHTMHSQLAHTSNHYHL